jgi:phage shock protein PspC (stress-responsive transcriptional regulator)
MKLTDRQEERIGRYIDEVANELAELDDDGRRSALNRVRARIREELRQFTARDPDDQDIEMVLRACGSPTSQASYLMGKKPMRRVVPAPAQTTTSRPTTPRTARSAWSLDTEAGRFLGVCAGMAHEFDLDPRALRVFIVLLAIVSGPVAVLLYLGAFAFMLFQTPASEAPDVPAKPLVGTLIVTFAIGLAIFVGMELVVWAITFVYQKYLGGSVQALSPQWRWIADVGIGRFIFALFCSLPLAALSALPVPANWGRTLRKLSHAVLAVYAVYLAYGVACLLTGVVLDLAEQVAGQNVGDVLSTFIY